MHWLSAMSVGLVPKAASCKTTSGETIRPHFQHTNRQPNRKRTTGLLATVGQLHSRECPSRSCWRDGRKEGHYVKYMEHIIISVKLQSHHSHKIILYCGTLHQEFTSNANGQILIIITYNTKLFVQVSSVFVVSSFGFGFTSFTVKTVVSLPPPCTLWQRSDKEYFGTKPTSFLGQSSINHLLITYSWNSQKYSVDSGYTHPGYIQSQKYFIDSYLWNWCIYNGCSQLVLQLQLEGIYMTVLA